MKDSSDFQQIKKIYDQKKKELRNKKNKSIYGTVAIVLICIFLLALLANPLATILLLITIAALLLIGFILFKRE